MKILSVFILILFTYNNSLGITVKEIIGRVQTTNLPFDCSKTAPWSQPIYGLYGDKLGSIPIHTYQDLGLTQRTDYERGGGIFRKFSISNSYELLALTIGESDPSKQLLITFDKEGKVIDFIEAGVFFCLEANMYIKQWRISADKKVIVTWLKIETTSPIPADSDFNSFSAQRIDSYYEINATGLFREIKKIKYQPQIYERAYLMDETRNLWEGTEIPIME